MTPHDDATERERSSVTGAADTDFAIGNQADDADVIPTDEALGLLVADLRNWLAEREDRAAPAPADGRVRF